MARQKWEPTDREAFMSDYRLGTVYSDLAQKYGTTYDKVKHYLSSVKREDIPSISNSIEKQQEDFLHFMSRSRTTEDVYTKYGEENGDRLLNQKYSGYRRFDRFNEFGKKVFAFLPDITESIQVKTSVYHTYSPVSDTGFGNQPYLMVQMPDNVWKNSEDEIILVPLYDVHYGHHAHKYEKFLKYIEYIETTPNVFTWGGGDLVENALDDGRGMTYEQKFHPKNQIGEMIKHLSRIAHKTLFMLPGNHEWRTYGKTGIDPTHVIADRLGIPYFDGPVIMDIFGNNQKWRIHAQHGNTNSQTKGGKLNSAGRPRRFIQGVHFFVSGHVHDAMVNPEVMIDIDPIENRLVYPQQWTVIAPSFLHWENTYAYRAGYAPPAGGGISMHLYGNGEYEAKLWNRR